MSARAPARRRRAVVPVLCVLALACTDGRPDDGVADAGPDAGTLPVPKPVPFVRLLDAQDGTSHGVALLGVVAEHGPARNVPAAIADRNPARALAVAAGDGSRTTLWYTLPIGYGFRASVGESVRLWYRERVAGSGSSYGARVETAAGELRAVFEDGTNGPALEPDERYQLAFELDDVPLDTQLVECGRRVRHPLVVTLPPKSIRVDPGEEEPFQLPGGAPVLFTLLDAWRLEGSVCGQAAPLSLGYFLGPPRP